jgi:hypothetical protein
MTRKVYRICILQQDKEGQVRYKLTGIHILYTFLIIHCYITVNLYLTCPCSSCWRIHNMYTFLVIHCYNTVNLYLTFMSEEEDDCLYDRLIEPNRFRIVKYFDPYVVFDIMRQEGVITNQEDLK